MTEDKATRYHRLKRRSEVAGLLWSAVCFSALLLTGVARQLADAASTLTGGSLLLAVPLVAVGLSLAYELGTLPLAWFSGYRLDPATP